MPNRRQKGEKEFKNAWSYDNGGGSDNNNLVLFAVGSACVASGSTADTCGIFVFYNVGGNCYENCGITTCRIFQKNTFVFCEKQER